VHNDCRKVLMKALRKPRIQLENRPFLPDHIPLRVPFIIFVDPSDKCNLLCNFCPTGDHKLMRSTPGRYYGPMNFQLFTKIIGDICKFERPIKVLRMYKDGEPLSNPELSAMVKLAKQSGCCEVVDTTTNAVLLTRSKADGLVEAGLDRINISIYGVRGEQYEQFCGRSVDFGKLVENIRYFYEVSRGRCTMNIKINGDVIPKEDVERFYEIFGNICDEINDEHVMSCWPEFDQEAHGVRVNELIGIYGQALTKVQVCPYVFYAFSINSDGSASTCFLDWQRTLIIGDVREQSIADIWRGAQLRKHQLMMLRGERSSHPTCHNCGQLTHGMPDNIDDHRKIVLEKLVILNR
jgi:MoaA/NifB/PqqE/SkfB family radical SAM enzyme